MRHWSISSWRFRHCPEPCSLSGEKRIRTSPLLIYFQKHPPRQSGQSFFSFNEIASHILLLLQPLLLMALVRRYNKLLYAAAATAENEASRP